MAIVVPTVTAEDSHTYREQLERIEGFVERIHLDFMDGLFTGNASIDLKQAWVPENKRVDLHLMYMRPDLYVDAILLHHPDLVVVHAEAKEEFASFANVLHAHGIKVGVALLQNSPTSSIESSLADIDHVLIFSGDLGHFGGTVDFGLLDKVSTLKALKPDLEIGWDGGINDSNIRRLLEGRVDVLNVGGFIQRADDPEAAYRKLQELVG